MAGIEEEYPLKPLVNNEAASGRAGTRTQPRLCDRCMVFIRHSVASPNAFVRKSNEISDSDEEHSDPGEECSDLDDGCSEPDDEYPDPGLDYPQMSYPASRAVDSQLKQDCYLCLSISKACKPLTISPLTIRRVI